MKIFRPDPFLPLHFFRVFPSTSFALVVTLHPIRSRFPPPGPLPLSPWIHWTYEKFRFKKNKKKENSTKNFTVKWLEKTKQNKWEKWANRCTPPQPFYRKRGRGYGEISDIKALGNECLLALTEQYSAVCLLLYSKITGKWHWNAQLVFNLLCHVVAEKSKHRHDAWFYSIQL
jgi:hypothetical protein